jgi:hypothetical protein
MAAKTKPKKEKVKQAHLDGMDPPSIQEVELAADAYYDAMMDRCELSTKEKETQGVLQEVMKKHGLTLYKMPDGRTCVVEGSTKVRIHKPKAPKERDE